MEPHTDPYDFMRDWATGQFMVDGTMTARLSARLSGMEALFGPESKANEFARMVLNNLVGPLRVALFKLWGNVFPGLKLADVHVLRDDTGGDPKLDVNLLVHRIIYGISSDKIIGNVDPVSISLLQLVSGHMEHNSAFATLVEMIDHEFRHCYPQLFE